MEYFRTLVASALLLVPIQKCSDDRVRVEMLPFEAEPYVEQNGDTVTLYLPRGEKGATGSPGSDGRDGADGSITEVTGPPALPGSTITEIEQRLDSLSSEINQIWNTPVTIGFKVHDGEIRQRQWTIRELQSKRFVIQFSMEELANGD